MSRATPKAGHSSALLYARKVKPWISIKWIWTIFPPPVRNPKIWMRSDPVRNPKIGMRLDLYVVSWTRLTNELKTLLFLAVQITQIYVWKSTAKWIVYLWGSYSQHLEKRVGTSSTSSGSIDHHLQKLKSRYIFDFPWINRSPFTEVK